MSAATWADVEATHQKFVAEHGVGCVICVLGSPVEIMGRFTHTYRLAVPAAAIERADQGEGDRG